MVKLALQKKLNVARFSGRKENKSVRNLTILASADLEKSIVDSLVTAKDLLEEENVDYLDSSALCLKPSNQSFCYRMSEEHGNQMMLLNLIRASSSFVIPDSALVVFDWKAGMSTEMKKLVAQAIGERVKPVYIIDMDGPSFLMLPSDGEIIYQRYLHAIDKANSMLENCEDKLLGDSRIRPEKGTCAFSCIRYGWALTLTQLAKFYAPQFGLSEKKMKEKLWGDHFFDTETNIWTCKNTGSPTCKRGFVFLCLDLIREVVGYCMEDEVTKLCSLLKPFGVKLKTSAKGLKKNNLLKHVMQTWTPSSSCLLDLIFCHLPSPIEAQLYRVENLYKGPLNDDYATSIRKSDPNGPLILYISKVIPACDRNTASFALGRVFSGKLKHGTKVWLLGPNNMLGQRKDLPPGVAQSFVDEVGAKDGSAEIVIRGSAVWLIDLDVTEDATVVSFGKVDAYPISTRATDKYDITLKAVGATSHLEYHIPYSIYNELYLHQREAIFWLWSIHCQDTGAILADDMGLGKTREVAAFIAGLIHSRLVSTVLIIAPCSVVDEWHPVLDLVGVNCKKYLGTKDKCNLNSIVQDGGVLITSYDIYRLHLSTHALNWQYVFLDEGHRIKNRETKTYSSLKSIKSLHKIIVTGTPVQNDLLEFHTIMSFCNPNLLGTLDEFKIEFIFPIDRGKYKDVGVVKKLKYSVALKDLKNLIRPYVLRRTKQLLKEQGRLESEKHEILVWIQLSATQVQLYTKLVEHEDKTPVKEKKPLLAARIAEDICNHPELLLNTYSGSSQRYQDMKERMLTDHPEAVLREAESSCKLLFLTYLVSELVEQNHRILIFAQSPRMLHIIESALIDVIGEESLILMDGTTPVQERRELIRKFQASISSPSVFLLSSKVGGVGVTLTKASRVIIFDPSKNPSDDDQSVDRVYRIGQEKDVLVYRLVTCGTIEEFRYRQKIIKGETSCSVLGEHQCKKGINKQDRNVLTLPLRGFGYCQTEKELETIYGDHGFASDVRTDIKFTKRNKSVVGLTNHGRLFSIKDDVVLDEMWLPGMDAVFSKREQIKSCVPTKTAKAQMPIDAQEVLSDNTEGYKYHNLKGKQIEKTCVPTRTAKAQKSVDAEDKKEKIRIYVSNYMYMKLVIRKQAMMEHIRATSGACIQRMSLFDRLGEKCLDISGRRDQVQAAKEMILNETK